MSNAWPQRASASIAPPLPRASRQGDPRPPEAVTQGQRRPRADARHRLAHLDWPLVLAAAASTLVALVMLYWSYRSNLILAYQDSASHLNIARRVFDSRTPGIVMLGTVWLPIPHLMLEPFVNIDALFYSGLAGSCVGLPCFVITAVLLFLSIRLIARHEVAAWAGLLVFILNPNSLYLQTTALTEPVLLMTMTAAGYFLLRWSKSDAMSSLLIGGLLTALAVGSRYEGWFFALSATVLISVMVYLRWRDPARTEGLTLAYLTFPVYAMFMWFFYNWLIFGDPLEFQHGKYSAAAAQQSFAQAGLLPTKHNLGLSIMTYGWTVLDNLGGVVCATGIVGLLIYLRATRLRPDSLIPYAFLSAFVFNVISLWAGQTVILTQHTHPAGYFNVRYGIMLLPAAAFFIGYLTDFLATRLRVSVAAGLLLLAVLGQSALWIPHWPDSAVTIADGLHGISAESNGQVTGLKAAAPSALYLRTHYTGGGILMYNGDYSWFPPEARLDMRAYIDAYSGKLWDAALRNPIPYAEWVVLHPGVATDPVAKALNGNANFRAHYTRQFEAYGYAVYRRMRI